MKLAKLIKRPFPHWQLGGGTLVNPPVGTIVRYEDADIERCHVVYFPGCTAELFILAVTFDTYFEEINDVNA